MSTTRFSLLAIGQTFEFQGEHYIKVTPLLAEGASGGKRRMIPRSATIEATLPSAPQSALGEAPTPPLLGELEHYHDEVCRCLTRELGGELGEVRLAGLLSHIDGVHQTQLERLAHQQREKGK